MEWNWALGIGAVVVFSAGSFFFALGETALFSLGQWRVAQLPKADPKRGACAAQLLREPQDLLATIVFGNTICNASIVAIGLLAALEQQWPLTVALPAMLLYILLGCEVIPKTLAVRDPERWALKVAAPIFKVNRVTKPFREVGRTVNEALMRALIPKSIPAAPAVTDEEYQELIETAAQQGALGQSEKEIISRIIQLDQLTAREVMKPRSQMSSLPDDMPIADMVQAARAAGRDRLPLYDETPDRIIGILNARALLLNPDVDLSEVVEFPSFVPESMNLLQLLQALQRQQRGLAIVLDEFGGTAGIITIEDILEELIGTFAKDADRSSYKIEKLGKFKWRVTGNTPIEEFRREYPDIGEIEEVDTLNGLMIHLCEVVPAPGESVSYKGIRLTADKADERRVHELVIEATRRPG